MGFGEGAGKFSRSAVLWVEEVEKKVSAGAVLGGGGERLRFLAQQLLPYD
jgi:hypothetical protein